MKCDDDSFINIPNLIHVLMGGTIPVYTSTITLYDSRTIDVRSKKNRLNADRNLLTGFLFCEVRPIADAKNKWYILANMNFFKKVLYSAKSLILFLGIHQIICIVEISIRITYLVQHI